MTLSDRLSVTVDHIACLVLVQEGTGEPLALGPTQARVLAENLQRGVQRHREMGQSLHRPTGWRYDTIRLSRYCLPGGDASLADCLQLAGELWASACSAEAWELCDTTPLALVS